MTSPSLPLFRSLRLLRGLNVIGVGCALATLTGVVFGVFFGGGSVSSWREAAMVTSAPTLVVGMVWAAMLRWRRTVGRRQMRLGWALSVPLAILNATLAASLMFADTRPLSSVLLMLVPTLLMCATLGAMFWVPALAATLLLFGAPIAWAQRLARRGLAGEERGELLVGSIVSVLSLLGLLGVLVRPTLSDYRVEPLWDDVAVVHDISFAPRALVNAPDSLTAWWLCGLATVGLAAGMTSALLAWQREQHRRRFVADAEAGRAPGYRVEPTAAGKVLVRLADEHGYRHEFADDEELFALDEQGLATHAPEPREPLAIEPSRTAS